MAHLHRVIAQALWSGVFGFGRWAFCDLPNLNTQRNHSKGVTGYGQSPCSEAVPASEQQQPVHSDKVSPSLVRSSIQGAPSRAWPMCAVLSLRALKNRYSGLGVLTLLVLLLAMWSPASSYANIPSTRTNPEACTQAPCPTEYEYKGYNGGGLWFGSLSSACVALAARYGTTPTGYRMYCSGDGKYYGGISPTGVTSPATEPVVPTVSTLATRVPNPVAPTYSCPANASLVPGDPTSCTCNQPQFRENAAHTQCIPASGCEAGVPVTSAIDTIWARPGDQVSIYAAQAQAMNAGGCGTAGGSGGGCKVRYTSSNAPPIGVPGNNGYSFYTSFLNGATTGESCTVPTPSPKPPEPPCEGQQGQANGVTVCLPKQTPAQQAAAAAAQAQAAAQAASQACAAAGHSATICAAAAAAAGNAAAAALAAGSSSTQAAAAGAAAGAAAQAAALAGQTPKETNTAAAVAAAIQAAMDRAVAMATASGASTTIIQQASASASAAASVAAANVLTNGGTYAQAAAAAAMAGQTATASVIAGSTGTQATAAGVAAGNGAAAGGANGPGGTGGANGTPGGQPGPQDPVGDFCKTNPMAKMCKNEPDSSFAGACGAPPACSGDAVMCAVAAATFASNCAMTKPPTVDAAEVSLYKTEAAKPQGDQTGAGATTVNVGPSAFDQTNILGGGGGGVSDLQITVFGKTVTLPLSSLNEWLARLGVITQAVTFLLCARIVMRG